MKTSEILFSCIEQRFRRGDRTRIAADAWQVVTARFNLCPAWDGLTVYARFFCDAVAEPLTIRLEDRSCPVPWEAVSKPGSFEVAIFGEGGSGEVLTSTRVVVPVYPSVEYDEYPPVDYEWPEPTPSILQTIEKAAAQAAEDARVAREAAERAEEAAGTAVATINFGHGLTYNKDTRTVSVDTAEAVERDNTLPITAAAVYTELGGLNALLATI